MCSVRWMGNRHLWAQIVLQSGHNPVPQQRIGENTTLRDFPTVRSGKCEALLDRSGAWVLPRSSAVRVGQGLRPAIPEERVEDRALLNPC